MPDLWINLLVFIVGVATGAAGQYFGEFFTDRRKQKEEEANTRRKFAEVEAMMPALIAEMRTDLLEPRLATSREFFPYNGASICAPKPGTLFYDPAVHEDLHSKLMILENNGYILNVSENDTDRYRMSEEFVALIKAAKTEESAARRGTLVI